MLPCHRKNETYKPLVKSHPLKVAIMIFANMDENKNNVPILEMECKTKNTKQTSWNEFLK